MNRPEETAIVRVEPDAVQAAAMSAVLWAEIQERYGFTAPDPFDPDVFRGSGSGIWVALAGDDPVGSIALAAASGSEVAELDLMYVAPEHRGTGLADALLNGVIESARQSGIRRIRLRAGSPQPEALRFYTRRGFEPIAPFGRWVDDPTARCFSLDLD